MNKSTDTNSIAIDKYLESLPEQQRIVLKKLRQTIKEIVPEAQEVISYQMPAYKYHGMLVGFAAFKNHCSFFPWNSKTVEQFKEELNDFSVSKGTIRFTPEKPIPDALLKKIIEARVNDNLSKSKKK
ncbi:iron chaperone [Flavobacterium sp. LB1P71]|uniref:iron chaperone n=1 Tax=unclassified Flavobacterium TaxID=196869 RepID=UPI003AADD15C